MKDFQSLKDKFKNLRKKSKTFLQKGIKTYKKIFHQYENDIALSLIPLILIVILTIINLMNKQVMQQVAALQLSHTEYPVQVHPYPLLISQVKPDISAQTAIVMDADSQVILYAKNPTVRFSMASTTKIMTALVGFDYFQKNSILAIKTPTIEGSHTGFYQGEKFTFLDLLYAMMLPSSNEAAYAIAENYPAGKDEFIQKMNEKAQQFHLSETHYGDPAGLDDDQNFTTVVDLARLASVAVQNPTLAKIISTRQHTIADQNGKQFPLQNLNQLLGIQGINGVKTGTTEAAGEVLVTSTTQNGHTFIIVVMRSQERFVDTLKLVSLLENNVQYISPDFINK
jgi:D-alanyl-D-alanine carboxypeptidase (penicillin-binding protein 5/6)